MKTLQKTIWINYLIISISLLLNSCDTTTEYRLATNFIYKNLTSENIEIFLYDENNIKYKDYLIEPNKEIKVLIERDGAKTGIGQPFRMTDDSRYIAKKVIIKFNTANKCLSFLEGEGMLNVKSYDNFTESMYNTSNNTLIYNIDQTELDKATACP